MASGTDPFLAEDAKTQVRLGCERATRSGVAAFTKEDRIRYSILEGQPDNPCAE